MSHVVSEREVDRATVLGVDVAIMLAVWDDGGRSYSVHRVDNDVDLTVDESFPDMPTSGQIAALLDALAGPSIVVPRDGGVLLELASADDVVTVILPPSERGHPRRITLTGDGRYAVEYRTSDGWQPASFDLQRFGMAGPGVPCDECGALIPDRESSETNHRHQESCSLHWSNVETP